MADLDGQHTGLRLAAGGTNQQLCATQLPARRQGSGPHNRPQTKLTNFDYSFGKSATHSLILDASCLLPVSLKDLGVPEKHSLVIARHCWVAGCIHDLSNINQLTKFSRPILLGCF